MDPKACPNYPFCSIGAPADFPTPVVNGEPLAPILNTTPEQTAFWQKVSQQIFPRFCLDTYNNSTSQWALFLLYFFTIFTHEINGLGTLIQIVSLE